LIVTTRNRPVDGEADVAIRTRKEPTPRPDPAQAVREGLSRLLLAEYIKHSHGPRTLKLATATHHQLSDTQLPQHLKNRNGWSKPAQRRRAARGVLQGINLSYWWRLQQGLGIAALPDYVEDTMGWSGVRRIRFDSTRYLFVYPED